MLAALIIFAVFAIGCPVVGRINKPTKRSPRPLPLGKSLKKAETVTNLLFPRLDD